eukprot:GHRR01023101.1.p1 GENE.GHRR01023101.1~~GHRR01023101.1.p1  ORF type:complete len:152 (-),score=23.62 GHRR01023101.1:696-1151(-)
MQLYINVGAVMLPDVVQMSDSCNTHYGRSSAVSERSYKDFAAAVTWLGGRKSCVQVHFCLPMWPLNVYTMNTVMAYSMLPKPPSAYSVHNKRAVWTGTEVIWGHTDGPESQRQASGRRDLAMWLQVATTPLPCQCALQLSHSCQLAGVLHI